jgi:hypothetical protein
MQPCTRRHQILWRAPRLINTTPNDYTVKICTTSSRTTSTRTYDIKLYDYIELR